MMLISLRLLIAVLILAAVGPSHHVEAQSPNARLFQDSEDYTILDEALKDFALRQEAATVSIVRFTHLPVSIHICLSRSYDSAQWQSAVKDLRAKNASIYVFDRKFNVPFEYLLSDEMEEVGGDRPTPPGKDHREFILEEISKLEQRSREHFTQVQMAAPGVSEDGQIALVYSAISYAGQVQVLRKKNDGWSVDPKPLCAWIS